MSCHVLGDALMRLMCGIVSSGFFTRALLACFACLACLAACSWTATASAAPNVIIFYADDLGWGELGCQGSKDIPTPHIDSLATNGIRCTQGYVAAA